MSVENMISIEIQPQEIQDSIAAIKTIEAKIGKYLIALTKEQRQTLPKMKDNNLPFVEKAMEYAETSPQFVPPYLEVVELRKDLEAVKALMKVFRPLAELTAALDDTIMLAGSESYTSCLTYYKSVQQAAKMKVKGAQVQADELGKRFEIKKAKPANLMMNQ